MSDAATPDGPAYVYRAECLRVIDGDTIEARVDLGFEVDHVVRLRLNGYNAPETRGVQRAEGLRARGTISGLVTGRPLLVRTIRLRGRDVRTFERYAADVWVERPDGTRALVADVMKSLGFDVPRPS